MMNKQAENRVAGAGVTNIPGLVWKEYNWEGTIELPQWEAFNKGQGSWKAPRMATNARRRQREKRAGQERFQYADCDLPIRLSVSSLDEDAQLAPGPEQMQAYQLLLAHEAELLTATLEEFKKYWSEILCVYDHSDDDPNRHSLPRHLRAPEELCGLIELHHVYIKRQHSNGIAHVGLALSCDWDSEHGLGVYACNGKILGLGSGDLAFGRLSTAFRFCRNQTE
jgi:hypothetical protein